jgi:SAM-dependent methyltransferase
MSNNIDNRFIAKPHKMKYIVMRYLQSFHKTKFIEKFIKIEGLNLLDFGGGSGSFCGYLKENVLNIRTHLFDPSIESLDRARSLFGFADHEMSSDFNQINQKFDLITAFFVYAYIPDKKIFWNNCSSALKVGGFLFVEVDNRNGLYFRLTRHMERPDENWHIDLSDIPKDLNFLGNFMSPWSNHMSEISFKTGFWYYFLKYSLRLCEVLLNKTESKIYVFRKSDYCFN